MGGFSPSRHNNQLFLDYWKIWFQNVGENFFSMIMLGNYLLLISGERIFARWTCWETVVIQLKNGGKTFSRWSSWETVAIQLKNGGKTFSRW